MKEGQDQQDEKLDRLLKSVQAPKAPDWFEARTRARLRREREQSVSGGVWAFLFSRPMAWTSLAACIVALLGIAAVRMGGDMDVPEQASVPEEMVDDEKLQDALDAFVSYSQEVQQWDQDFFR